MQKTTQQLLIIVTVMLFLIGMLFFIWNVTTKDKVIEPESISGLNNETIVETNQLSEILPKPKVKNEIEIENTPYLSLAKKILTQINSQADSRGIHGSIQDCEKKSSGEYECKLRMLDFLADGNLYAHHRHALTLVWAKYQYYLQTGDEKQLESMQKDINNMIKVLESDVWVMQANKFNCALMKDLVGSEYLSTEYKDKAKRFCSEVSFEMHPESLAAYSQYVKKPFNKIDLASLAEDQRDYETSIQIDEKRIIKPEERINYDSKLLIAEISQDLENLYYNRPLKTKSQISQYDQERFINRELIAAIDQVGAMELFKNDKEKYEERLIDYLLLTKETLSWFAENPNIYGSAIRCLLFENINYYINNFDKTLTMEQKQAYNDRIVTDMSNMTDGSFYCHFAKDLLSDEKINKQKLISELQEKNRKENTSDWSVGFLRAAAKNVGFGSYYYNIEVNSLLAGMLAK